MTKICGKCGKEFRGKEWQTICPDCYKAQKDAERAAEKTKKAEILDAAWAAFASRIALPALKGSDKQIKWANDIRREMVAFCVCKGLKTLRAADPLETLRAEAAKGQKLSTLLLSDSAHEWIDAYNVDNGPFAPKGITALCQQVRDYLWSDAEFTAKKLTKRIAEIAAITPTEKPVETPTPAADPAPKARAVYDRPLIVRAPARKAARKSRKAAKLDSNSKQLYFPWMCPALYEMGC
jgi:hypothetical protein